VTGSHYFDVEPAVGSARRTVTLALPDVTLELTTDRGVFSADRVDPGTKLLLQELPPPPAHGHLLDLGCGYGPIAVTVARRSPGAQVWAVDTNTRACELTELNARRAGAANVRVGAPESVPPATRFAAVYSNPPIRIGKDALHRLITAWLPRLDPGGSAFLVVNKNLGADSLASWMADELGWGVERLVSRIGYRLLEVVPVAS